MIVLPPEAVLIWYKRIMFHYFYTVDNWTKWIKQTMSCQRDLMWHEAVKVWTYLLTLFDTFCCWVLTASSQREQHYCLVRLKVRRRVTCAAMVVSNVKSLNLKRSVWFKVHSNLVWSAALKSLSTWSHFLLDDELKLYMKSLGCHLKICHLDDPDGLSSCFPCWIWSIIQKCFVMQPHREINNSCWC